MASFVIENGGDYLGVFDVLRVESKYLEVARANGHEQLKALGWIDDDSIIIQLAGQRSGSDASSTVGRWTLLVAVVGLDLEAPVVLVPGLVGLRGDVIATLPAEDERILFALSDDPESAHEVDPRAHLLTGAQVDRFHGSDSSWRRGAIGRDSRIARRDGHVVFWGAGPRGDVQLAVSWGERERVVWFRDDGRGRWIKALSRRIGDEEPDIEPVGVSADGKRFIVRTSRDRGTAALYEYDPDQKQLGSLLFAHPDLDVVAPIYMPGTTVAIGAVLLENGLPTSHYFESSSEAVRWLEQRFEGNSVAVLSKSMSGRQVVVVVYGATDAGTFYVLDLDQRRMVQFGRAMPWVDPDRMARIERFTARAEGGPEVEALLTMPKGVDRPHLVVMLHGGPIDVFDTRTFNPVAQEFARRGYAVLRVSYRRSAGYGTQFHRQRRRQWGLGIEGDIEATLDSVVSRGRV